MKITFLGTSSWPTKTRNSQSIIIEFKNGKAAIVDCGEGTQRQLMQLDNIPEIEAVFITHHHIDHIAGLPGLIMYLYKINNKRIKLIAPKKVLEICKILIETLVEFIDNPVEYIQINEKSQIRFSYVTIYSFRTFHTDSSVGYSFKDKYSNVTICGDLEFHNKYEKDKILKAIEGSNSLIIDIVHIKDNESLELLQRFSHIDKLLLPVPIGKDNLINKSLKVNKTRIPNDFDNFYIKETNNDKSDSI